MADIDKTKGKTRGGADVSRREFVLGIGGVGVGAVFGGYLVNGFLMPDKVFAIPASEGYLLVDTLKCASCQTCMVACSLAHEGSVSPSTARIQVVQDRLHSSDGQYQQQCRQCPFPACVDVCPTGACNVDEANGNVRWINQSKCIGCQRCVDACPFTPSRAQFNAEKRKAQKCDLCKHAEYWDSAKGPACIAVCPMNAISLSNEIPSQNDDGYNVNLRNEWWGKWWPYDQYTTWPKGQTTDPSTWPMKPMGYTNVYAPAPSAATLAATATVKAAAGGTAAAPKASKDTTPVK